MCLIYYTSSVCVRSAGDGNFDHIIVSTRVGNFPRILTYDGFPEPVSEGKLYI